MTLMLNRIGRPQIMFNAEGGAGGDGGANASAESVLFPGDNDAKAGGEGDGGDKAAANASAGQSDWKEYEADPSKTPEENAAAKAEHDKAKPAAKDDKNDPANKVPDDGKYDLKMPDGVELDAELAGALGPEFKELGLTNAQAQKLVDKYIDIQQKRAEGHAASPEGAWSLAAHKYFTDNGTPDKWADTAKTDKEIGGDKWNGTVQNATRFVNSMGTPALKEFLNASGGGNHPELIRVFAKAGELIREDNAAAGGASGSGKPADAAHILFKDDVPKGN